EPAGMRCSRVVGGARLIERCTVDFRGEVGQVAMPRNRARCRNGFDARHSSQLEGCTKLDRGVASNSGCRRSGERRGTGRSARGSRRSCGAPQFRGRGGGACVYDCWGRRMTTTTLDPLDTVAATVFEGYLVRKDLVRKYSRQY